MTRRSRRVVTTFAALSALAAAVVAAQNRAPSSARAAIDQVLTAAVSRHDVPGVVAGVVDRQGVRYQAAFGSADATTGRPLSIDAVFRIYSMTKPVTSVAAMQLVEQGRIALDATAATYVPDIADVPVLTSFDPATGAYAVHRPASPITVRQLMTHTAGFGYRFTSATVRDFKPREGDRFPDVPLLFEPGERWWYGTSVDWLGRVVERVSGQTLDAYFREHIFLPLGMASTGYNVPEAEQARVPVVHRRAAQDRFTASPNQFTPLTTFNGGGGLFSTASDYLRFERMLLNGGALDGVRILRPESVKAMGTNQIGGLTVHALTTAQPEVSSDFSFVSDGRDKWGLGFLISVDPPPGRRSPGSLSWAGLANTWFWIDPARGVAGLFFSQMLPFADARVLSAYDGFERAVYGTLQR